MPDNENPANEDDEQAEEEVQDLPPEEGEANEVTGGRRVAFPG